MGQKMEKIANNPDTNHHDCMIFELNLEIIGINKENLQCMLNSISDTLKETFSINNKIIKKLDFLKKFYSYLKNISKIINKTKIIDVIKEI